MVRPSLAPTPSVAKYDPLTDSPLTISVTDGRARRRTNVADAATWENDVWAVCTSRKSGSETVPVSSRPLYGVTITATRSGSWMPRPRRNTASTIEYTAVVIATPTASERIAKVVKRGVAPSRLSASLRSWPTAIEGSTPGYRPITPLKPPSAEKCPPSAENREIAEHTKY